MMESLPVGTIRLSNDGSEKLSRESLMLKTKNKVIITAAAFESLEEDVRVTPSKISGYHGVLPLAFQLGSYYF